MQRLLPEKSFKALQQALPASLRPFFENQPAKLAQTYPLLSLLCPHKEPLALLRETLGLADETALSEQEMLRKALDLCRLRPPLKPPFLMLYRLPTVLSEFPIYSRAINKAVQAFNKVIETYHRAEKETKLDTESLQQTYAELMNAIRDNGERCDGPSLLRLVCMIFGYFPNAEKYFQEHFKPPAEIKSETPAAPAPSQKPATLPLTAFKALAGETPKNRPLPQEPFSPDYNLKLRAGRLSETHYLLLNAFGLKIGGHFDAQVKFPPRFISCQELLHAIHRHLSHRMIVPTDEYQRTDFDTLILRTLKKLGVQFMTDAVNQQVALNPFIFEPISSINPEKVLKALNETVAELAEEGGEYYDPDEDRPILAQYLHELLHGFQVNPGLALGIGANWDGTVNLSNEAGAYPFKFNETEAFWGKRFKQLSLHRQGPSEAYMDATRGVNFELQTLLTDIDYMTQIQPSEYRQVIYNALIDNLVADLFPEPGYFENAAYKKARKQYVVRHEESGDSHIDSFYQRSDKGTFFQKDEKSAYKQTPLFRRPGTLDVQAFPRDIACSENSRASYAGNPLVDLQLQYAQFLQNGTRGNIVYDPIAPDQFLPDPYYGQVVQAENGDFLPFAGVVPKNFDKHFHQDVELCASFVVRMMQSSCIREYCGVFQKALEAIKSTYLPDEKALPPLPTHFKRQGGTLLPAPFNENVQRLHRELATALGRAPSGAPLREAKQTDARSYSSCEKIFFSLFKNIIYCLYDAGQADGDFKSFFLTWVNSSETFSPLSRATIDRVLRELTVNRPALVEKADAERYEGYLVYLRELAAYFYPPPSETLAADLAEKARAYAASLVSQKGIQEYFKNLSQIKKANLSRHVSPATAFSALKHGGPSKSVSRDYEPMHSKNFPSYYRDPDGNQITEPARYERFFDWAIKKVGAFLQYMHKYQLLAVVRRPFVQPFVQAKQLRAKNHRHKNVWAVAGFLKGFFWDGLAIGVFQTVKTPFHMLYDVITSFGKKEPPQDNSSPLAISAAPANEPGLKVKAGMASRDYILQKIRACPDKGLEKTILDTKNELIKRCQEWAHTVQGQEAKLDSRFLDGIAWETLFTPFKKLELSPALLKHSGHINQNFAEALFAACKDPKVRTKSKIVAERIFSEHKLNPIQKDAFLACVQHFNSLTTPSKREQFAALFAFGGEVHKALKSRDQVLHQIQEWWMQAVFPPGLPLEEYKQPLTSEKDRAHSSWAAFMQRELEHKPLTREQALRVFTLMEKSLAKSNGLLAPLSQLKAFYADLITRSGKDDDIELQKFYDAGRTLQGNLGAHPEVQNSLRDLIDVTMNALINARLDAVTANTQYFFAADLQKIKNPLQEPKAIGQWLKELKENDNLRSLLEQQIQQTSSLDQALWRDKCILQALETALGGPQRIRNTGIQTVLRFWGREKENITRTGEQFMDPTEDTPKLLASTKALFEGSETMKHARDRLQEKSTLLMRAGG